MIGADRSADASTCLRAGDASTAASSSFRSAIGLGLTSTSGAISGADRSAAGPALFRLAPLPFAMSSSTPSLSTLTPPEAASERMPSCLAPISFCSAAIGDGLTATPASTTGAERSEESLRGRSDGGASVISFLRSAIGDGLIVTSGAMTGADRSPAASSTCLSPRGEPFATSARTSLAATRCAPVVAKPLMSACLASISF
mmetsp:Transcript_34924/g.106963  ORF Transcript_34924/g.106963 Transcript_34924/m.106963 type:complete len:201 (-) Transcript_34924:397-999(-)